MCKVVCGLYTLLSLLTSLSYCVLIEPPSDLIVHPDDDVKISCSHNDKDLDVMLWYQQRKNATALALIGHSYGAASVNVQQPLLLFASESDTAKIECSHDDSGYNYVFWYQQKNNSTVMALIGYTVGKGKQNKEKEFDARFQLNRQEIVKGDLTISGLLSSDSAVYYCAVSAASVNVQQPLMLFANESDTIKIKCSHDDSTYTTVLWYQQKSNSTVMALIGYTVGKGEASVNVQQPLMLFANKSDTAKIECSHDDSIYNYVFWYQQKNDSTVMALIGYTVGKGKQNKENEFDDRFQLNRQEIVKGDLTISGLLSSDSAVYYCAVSAASVNVQQPLLLFANESNTAKIECSHDDRNYINVFWYQQKSSSTVMALIGYTSGTSNPNKEKEFDGRFQLNRQEIVEGDLTISGLLPSDSAVYYCAVMVASAIFYGVVCWGSSISTAERKRLDKLLKKAGSVLGSPLDPVQVVGDRRMLVKLASILENDSHPMHETLAALGSSFSDRLPYPKCVKEQYRRALSHPEKPGSTVRITFFDFSSAFNTIQLGFLKDKLEHVSVESHLSNWILDNLTNRPRYVRARDCVFDNVNHLQINAEKTKELVVDFHRCRHPPQLVNIQGTDIERVDSYKYLGVHLNNKLDWSVNTTALHKKGQSRLYLLRRLRSLGVQGAVLRTFFNTVVASAIFYGVVCWGISISMADRKRLNKLLKRAGSVLGSPLDLVQLVGDRRMLAKLASMLENDSHPMHETLAALGSSFSDRLLHPKCMKERYRSTATVLVLVASEFSFSHYTAHGAASVNVQQPLMLFANESNTAKIECSHDDSTYTTVLWYQQKSNSTVMALIGYTVGKGKQNKEKEFDARFQLNRQETVDGDLTISGLLPSDSAVYYCAVSNPNKEKEFDARFQLNRQETVKGDLTISGLLPSDSAVYYCAVSAASVNVQQPLMLFASESDTAKIDCSHDDSNYNYVFWYQQKNDSTVMALIGYTVGKGAASVNVQQPLLLFANESNTAKIECSHDGSTYSTVLWYQRKSNSTVMALIGYTIGTSNPNKENEFDDRFQLNTQETVERHLTISGLLSSDSAVYYCAVRRINCVTFRQIPSHLAKEADNVTITCSHNDSSLTYMYWYQQKSDSTAMTLIAYGYATGAQTHEDEFKERFRLIRKKREEGDLIILNVLQTDSAVYYCAARRINCVTFRQIPSHLAREADNVTITCNHNDSSLMYMYWYQQKSDSTAMTLIGYGYATGVQTHEDEFKERFRLIRKKAEEGDLIILNVLQTDSAVYYCAARRANCVTFHQIPSLMVKENDNVKIPCSHNDSSLLVMYWYQQKSDSTAMTLIGYGYATGRTTCVDIEQTSSLIANQNDNITINCKHKDSSLLNMLWYQQKEDSTAMALIGYNYATSSPNYEDEFENQHFKMNRKKTEEGELNILNVRQSDSAVYYCAASRHSAAHSYDCCTKTSNSGNSQET
ncbi:hypothetical protein NFI96_000501 [Prochilodus magdalenae]|nr:hypothetical protein NFI96_000501 [Prochilodus magdalenae]